MKTNENKTTTVWTKPSYGPIEYSMSKLMVKELLKTRRGTELNVPTQKFLCDYVNSTFGLKGNCTRVISK